MKVRNVKILALSTSMAALMSWSVLADNYTEAPMLAAKSVAGELPAVGKRLPKDPLIVVAPEVGSYGGTWRSALKGTNDVGWIRRSSGYDPLVSFDFEWSEIIPNVAKSWEVNEDATQYTFHLREGHKWSDGTPFTSEDIVFAINDVINNSEYPGIRPKGLLGATADGPNPHTLIINLPNPNGMLLYELASVDGTQVVQFQKNFCSQFHPLHNVNATESATNSGFSSWGEAMMNNCGVVRNRNAKRPTLYAWKQIDNYDGLGTVVRFERNPYYFKVDQKGNQLPYLDKLHMTQVEEVNSIVLMGIGGEIDMTNRHIDQVSNKPIFFDNTEKGGYQIYDTVPSNMNVGVIQFNLNAEDDGFRELFQNKQFRIALSHAIDRADIIDAIYAGQGEPFQAAPRPESPFYDEELAKQYTEYDFEKAIKILDDIGLETGEDGIRLLPDGRPVHIRIDVASDMGPFLDILELVKIHWLDVGINLDVRKAEKSFVYDQKQNNKHLMHIWEGTSGAGDALLDPRYYMPMSTESAFAPLWAMNWHNPENKLRQDPPESVAKQFELLEQVYASSSQEKRIELFKEILKISKEEFFAIGISLPPKGFGIATNEMGNVPQNQTQSWIYPTPGPMGTAVLFKRK